jgi:hypothetical protein
VQSSICGAIDAKIKKLMRELVKLLWDFILKFKKEAFPLMTISVKLTKMH